MVCCFSTPLEARTTWPILRPHDTSFKEPLIHPILGRIGRVKQGLTELALQDGVWVTTYSLPDAPGRPFVQVERRAHD
jgi:hypothetical protein